nr:unnamed protein product [Digitaria exilis]
MRGPAWRALLLVLALALADAAAARFVVEKNSIQVTSPDELKGKYECAIGNFGVPQYGGTLHGWVEYPKSNRKGCQSFDQFDISFKPKKAGGRPNFHLTWHLVGLDIEKVNKCVGDPDANEENEILKAEQDAQIGHGKRGDVTILPTLVINNRQYRGTLDKVAVLKAICSGFEETTEPAICLSEDIQTNECLDSNGGCWLDTPNNVTACKDTFRGRVCECPIVKGVKFVGDGYTHCEGVRSVMEDAGRKLKMGRQSLPAHLIPFSKCCAGKQGTTATVGWSFLWVIFFGLVFAGVGAYAVYKYRLRSYMDSEIRAIMAQYMPLDNQEGANQQHHVAHADDI